MNTTLPIKTVSEANVREHWAQRARRAKWQRRDAYMATPRHTLPCTVTLTRIAPRTLDDDNLRAALKAVRDGVADRLGVGDRDPRVVWEYGQEKADRPRHYAVHIAMTSGASTDET